MEKCTYLYVCVSVCVRVCVCACVRACVYTACVCVCVCIQTHTNTDTLNEHLCVCPATKQVRARVTSGHRVIALRKNAHVDAALVLRRWHSVSHLSHCARTHAQSALGLTARQRCAIISMRCIAVWRGAHYVTAAHRRSLSVAVRWSVARGRIAFARLVRGWRNVVLENRWAEVKMQALRRRGDAAVCWGVMWRWMEVCWRGRACIRYMCVCVCVCIGYLSHQLKRR